MTRLGRVAFAAAALAVCACGTNHPSGFGTVELNITTANNCAIPLNLDRVGWSLTLSGKAAYGASFTADAVTSACARGTSLGAATVFVGHYESSVTGYDTGNSAITNTATSTVDVFVGGSPVVNATLFPEPGSVAVGVTIECCVNPTAPSATGACSSALTPGACTAAGGSCVWACADMCCRGPSAGCATATDVPSCNAAATTCNWVRC